MKLCNIVASLSFSQTGIMLDCNNLGAQLFGFQNKNQLLHQSWEALIGEDFGSIVEELKGKPQLHQGYKLTLHHTDGSERLAAANFMWEKHSLSASPSLCVVLIELTTQLLTQDKILSRSDNILVQVAEEQKQISAALHDSEIRYRNSEERYRSLLESTDAALSMVDYDGCYLYLNWRSAKPFGMSATELIGKNVYDLFPSEQANQILADVRKVISTNQSISLEPQVDIMGKHYWFRTTIQPVSDNSGKAVAALINAVNITDKKEAELALRASEQRYRQMFELHRLPKLIVDPDTGSIVDANSAAGRFYGYDLKTLKSLTIFDINLASPDEIRASFAKAKNTEMMFDEHRHRGSGNQVRNVEIYAGPIEIDGKRLLYAIITDVTEKVRAKLALQETLDQLEQRVVERTAELEEERNLLRTVIDAVPDSIYVINKQHHLVLNNRAHLQVIGARTLADLAGKTVFDFFPPAVATKFYTADKQLFQNGSPMMNSEECVTSLNANVSWISNTKVPLRNLNGEIIGLVGMVRNISEYKANVEALHRSEKELRESQKKLQMVLDTIPVRVFWKDQDSVLQGCNLLFASDAGFDNVSDFLAYEQANRLTKHISPDRYRGEDLSVIETGTPLLEYDQRFKRSNGEELVIQTSKLPLRDEEGQIVGLLGVYVDITARREAEAALAEKFEEEQEMQSYLKALHEITLHLTQTETLDDFYHDVVALGLKHFGFERIGLYLHDVEKREATGTYGTNVKRQVINEYHLKLDLRTLDGALKEGFENNDRFVYLPEAPCLANTELICMGQNAIAALWQGGALGWLSIDNAIYHKPISKAQLEILALYAITVSSLLTRKRAEVAVRESEERFRVFTEAAPIATFIADQQGTLLLVNHETERLFGYKRDELIGQSVALLLPNDSRYIEILRLMTPTLHDKGNQTDTIELSARRKDGVFFPADLQLRYINIQSKPMIMHLVIDSTQRKLAEQSVRQSLEQERELVQLRSRFLSMASHEFRTPLATILLAAETIIAYREKMNSAQIDARLDKIRQHVMHMRDLLEDVLYLARVQAGRAKFEASPGDLERLCREIIEEFDGQTENRGRLIYSSTLHSAPQHYDESLVRKILNNLISNALKYSSAEKPVYVSLVQDASQLQITVRDQGIGIPSNDLKHLFEPFHRAENVGAIVGTGLGLSIAKQATELHGGTLLVASQVNVGTTFTVELPIS